MKVELQWAVRWVGEDLWCGFVEHVSFKSGMEERGSDGWCDNEVDGMRQEEYSKDWVMHNGKSDL